MWAQGNKFSSLLAVHTLSLFVWDDDHDWQRELEMGLEMRVCLLWDGAGALLGTSGHWAHLYSQTREVKGSLWQITGYGKNRVSTGPGMDFSFLSLSQGSWKWCLGLQSMGRKSGEFHGSLRWAEGSQASTPLFVCRQRILCVCCQEHIWVNSDEEITLWKSFFWTFPHSANETRSRCRNCCPALGSHQALQVASVRCLVCLMAQERNPKPVLLLECKFSAG